MRSVFDIEPPPANDGLLDTETVEAIRQGASTIPDIEAAELLVDQLTALMVSVSTGGPRLDDVNGDYRREYRALAAVLKRLGITNPNPFSDLWRWHGRWSNGTLPTYASRRSFIAELYEPVRETLDDRADKSHELAAPVDDGPTGWAEVDAKLGKLRRRMRDATDSDDFKAVALQCVSVLEALGRACFDAQRHLPPGETTPHPNDAKARIGHFVSTVAEDKRFDDVETIGRAAWRQAQGVKHRSQPTRADAGIAADACVLFVAMIRRLADEERGAAPVNDIPF